MSVGEGKLTLRPERYTVNTHDKPNRVSTMVVVTPDEKFVFVGTTFDEPASVNPDGSPALWVRRPGGPLRSVASNAPDPDGIVVFPQLDDGLLGTGRFHNGGGASPFYIAFLHRRPDAFVVGTAVGDGCVLGSIDANGQVKVGPLVKINTSAGLPSELCWLAVAPDDKTVYATNFGYGNISSYRINSHGLENRQGSGMPEGCRQWCLPRP
jgi:DNA-binding beta-propeller fold protein YncE